MSDTDHAMNKIEFSRVYSFRIGSIPVVFGHIKSDEVDGPEFFAAALSERELRRESGGYGASEAEAAADLFRLMRPGPIPGLFG